ncbi:MAG: GntR family transcriptional regulator [Spirochaetales bacterium]
MGTIAKQSLRDLAYQEIHEMIENSRFTPGARINVEELTLEMGVSRTPVWQAIGQLEKEGLLYSIPNKGVFMQELSPKEAIDLYSVREVLECMAAELASLMIDEGSIGQMEANLSEQRKAIESGDLVAYSKLDFDFHFAVYRSTANGYLIDLLHDIKKRMRPMVQQMNTILPELYQDHLTILEALKNRDAPAAKEGFRTHNERMKQLILKSIKTRSADE